MKYRNIALLTALTIILALSGCQDTTTPKTSAVIGVIVVPAAVNLQKGGSHQFTAVVEGINNPSQTVTWSVDSPYAAETGITAAGLLTVADDETAATLTIRAASAQDSTKSGTAVVTVLDSTTTSTVTSVTVAPTSISLDKGAIHQFTAVVEGTNNPSQAVTWSITSPRTAGTGITAAGTLTVANDESYTALTIRATSVQDNSRYGTAAVTVTGGTITSTITSVTVSPKTIALLQGATHQFTAVVSGTNGHNTDVDWSITSAHAAGTSITAAGLLTIAADETAATLTIRAASAQDSTKDDTATVTVTPPVSTVTGVTVSPPSASVTQGGTQTFTATVSGTNSPDQTVTWSVDTPFTAGTSITDGVLTVAAGETNPSLTVRATSVQNTGVSGTATVTVTPSGGGATVTIIDAFTQDSNLAITYTSSVVEGTSQVITFTDNNSYGDTPSYTYAWYFNGDLQTGTANSITIATDGLSGLQFGLAVVTIDGAVYSKEFSFLVTD